MEDTFYHKYLKYKKKYLDLKSNINGGYPLADRVLKRLAYDDEVIIDSSLNSMSLVPYYSRTGVKTIDYNRINQYINQNKRRIINNLFIDPSYINIYDSNNWSDHSMISLTDPSDQSNIYSWNTLHNDSLCNDSSYNNYIIKRNGTTIDVSNTKNERIVDIVSDKIRMPETKVIMLQECEYDIYHKLSEFIRRNFGSEFRIHYTPTNVHTRVGTTDLIRTAKYGNCIILRINPASSILLNQGVYKGQQHLNFQHFGIKFNFIIDGNVMYISTHLQNTELKYIVEDISSVIRDTGISIEKIILAGDFNARYNTIKVQIENKMNPPYVSSAKSSSQYLNPNSIDHILIFNKVSQPVKQSPRDTPVADSLSLPEEGWTTVRGKKSKR